MSSPLAQSLAGQTTSRDSVSALILGGRELADSIAEDFSLEGIQALCQYRQNWEIPSPFDPRGIEGLRNTLKKFRDLVEAQISDPGKSLLIHPGNSPWAERVQLASVGSELAMTVIAPAARALSLFSNKLTLIVAAGALKIPHLLLSEEPVQSRRELEAILPDPQPLMLKSVWGGSHLGIGFFRNREELNREFSTWLEQLRLNYGDAIFFAQRHVEGARSVLVPFVRMSSGEVHFFPFCDTSLQSQFKKMVEFCPVEGLEPKLANEIQENSRRILDRYHYVGAGTFEFLLDGSRFFLVGGEAKLNSSYRLWDKVGGTRTLSWQLAALEDREIPLSRPVAKSASAQSSLLVRIHAEDGLLRLPAPGYIYETSGPRNWDFNNGSQAKLALFYEASETVTCQSDGLIGLLWVTGRDRVQCLQSASRALSESWIAGSLQTDENFLHQVIEHTWVRENMFHYTFVEDEFVPEIKPPAAFTKISADLAAWIYNPAERSRWKIGQRVLTGDPLAVTWNRPVELWTHDGLRGASGYLNSPSGETKQSVRVCAFPVSPGQWVIRVGNWFRRVSFCEPVSTGIQTERKLRAMCSGRVHSILFREGVLVPPREPVILIECFRRVIPHLLSIPSRIIGWKTKAEETVVCGQELADLKIERLN